MSAPWTPKQKAAYAALPAKAKAAARKSYGASNARRDRPPPPAPRPRAGVLETRRSAGASGNRTRGRGQAQDSRGPSVASVVRLAVDARENTHIPPSIAMSPYSVMTSRSSFIVNTSTVANTDTVVIFSPHGISTTAVAPYAGAFLGNHAATPVLGHLGSGGNVPGTTEFRLDDAVMGAYAATLQGNVANAALHSMTIGCVSYGNNNTCEGKITVGCCDQRINRARFATWNALAASLLNRKGFDTIPATKVLSDGGFTRHLSPVDIANWNEARPLMVAEVATGANIALDTMNQFICVLSATTAVVVQYEFTVWCEWRVTFTDPALSSMAIKRNPTPQAVWDKAMSMGADTSGTFSESAKHTPGGAGFLTKRAPPRRGWRPSLRSP